MNVARVVPGLLIYVIVLAACSVEIGPPAPTPSPPVGTAASVMPVTWNNLNLSGKLVYTSGVFQDQSIRTYIRSLDLATGAATTIFQAPKDAWIDAVAVSPDSKEMVLAYIAPSDIPYGGKRALYRMPLDGSELPQLLFAPASAAHQYFQPQWSPDGNYVYFTHVNNEATLTYEIGRMAYPSGPLEKLADNASWPRVSADGALLVYVWIDTGTGVNQLYVAHADGTDAHQVPLTGPSVPTIIDAPMFSPDNQSILFSAPNYGQSSTPSLKLVRLAIGNPAANGSIPSDWWSVPVTGGDPIRLTDIRSLSLFGNFSPDKKHVVIYSTNGIFVMNPDGSELTVLVNDVGQIPGTVNSIP
jgi:Tol biopolymer transport system component